MKRLVLLASILVAGCGGNAAPGDPPREPKRTARTAAPELRPPAETDEQRERGEDAAAVLRRYYERIERGDYAGAWEMRGEEDSEAARRRFADNFKAYQRYHAEIGTPSLPAKAEGFDYVEVPVMITGAYLGGKSFGSTGSVTLRRAVSSETPGPRGWHIYTGGPRKPGA